MAEDNTARRRQWPIDATGYASGVANPGDYGANSRPSPSATAAAGSRVSTVSDQIGNHHGASIDCRINNLEE
jgi:hypothetical protein